MSNPRAPLPLAATSLLFLLSGCEGLFGVPATLNYDGDVDGLGVALVQYDYRATKPGEIWMEAPAEGSSQVLTLAEPPSEHVEEGQAFYLIALFEDGDGSGTHGPGEQWVSGGMLLGWAPDAVEGSTESEVMEAGWFAMDMVASELMPPSAVPVPVTRPTERIEFGGTVEGLGGAAAGLMVYPQRNEVETLIVDVPLEGDSWSLTLDGVPSAEHLLDVDGGGVADDAYEAPYSYLDRGEPGFVYGVDEIHAQACYEGSAMHLFWMGGSDDLGVSFYTLLAGTGLGWVAFGGNVVVPPDDLMSLTMTVRCE